MSLPSTSPLHRRRRRRRWPLILFDIVLLLVAAAWLVLSMPVFGDKATGERLARMKANPHFRDGAFVNDVPPASYTWADVKALAAGQLFGDEQRTPPGPLPTVKVDAKALKAASPSEGLRAFWIGHASVYIELEGVRLLVDPIFSDYASPFNVGPKRFQAPPIDLADLPDIDAVLITHDHYDHLDMPTVQQLMQRGTVFMVPLGIGAHLRVWGVPQEQIREFEWWQELPLRGLRIVSTPARHYSGRALRDRNATLWTSWSVIGARHRFYVSGDTGYSEHFSRIGERFGPFDMSFIKIGAYGPGAPWLDIHMSAEDAVRAHRDVRARRMFPVHWGTFNLAFHDWNEPVQRALVAAAANRVELVTPRLGEFVDADLPFDSKRWYLTGPAGAHQDTSR